MIKLLQTRTSPCSLCGYWCWFQVTSV